MLYTNRLTAEMGGDNGKSELYTFQIVSLGNFLLIHVTTMSGGLVFSSPVQTRTLGSRRLMNCQSQNYIRGVVWI